MGVVSTAVLIREHGTVSKKTCCSCGRQSVYVIVYGPGETLFLCSWCDVAISERWMR